MRPKTPAFAALLVLSAAVGLCAGTGGFTFFYAKGYSYLSDDPAACANCHIMREQFDGWVKSSHHGFATCNSCHLPKDFAGKVFTKASNGFWHSLYFTTGDFHEPIQVKPRNRLVVENNCRNCHSEVVHAMDGPRGGAGRLSCVKCHDSAGHPR